MKRSSRITLPVMSRPARAFSALVIVVTLAQAISLVSRGSRGESDFGVFYRTCQLLAAGMGGELYLRLDAVTTWPISLSPTGLAIFQPLVLLNSTMASAAWALFNLILLGISVVSLRTMLTRLQRVVVPTALLLLILSSGSIQVGQFSVLFVACWILACSSLAAGRYFHAGLFLAIPTAIKLYPLMMLAIPISLARSVRMGVRQVLFMLISLLIMCLLVPAVMYGTRVWALNVSFWENVVLSSTGQIQYMQFPRFGNQSLDALLLRYLTYEPDFHDVFVNIPHLWLDKAGVVAAANLIRVLIVLTTVASVWLWRRRASQTFGRNDLVTMAALWSATLYLLLPETKARYAVYALFGFIPLLQEATDHSAKSTPSIRTRRWIEIVLCVVLILVLLPVSIQAYGVGFLGALLLWFENIRHVRRHE
jgi:hypothetical protein